MPNIIKYKKNGKNKFRINAKTQKKRNLYSKNKSVNHNLTKLSGGSVHASITLDMDLDKAKEILAMHKEEMKNIKKVNKDNINEALQNIEKSRQGDDPKFLLAEKYLEKIGYKKLDSDIFHLQKYINDFEKESKKKLVNKSKTKLQIYSNRNRNRNIRALHNALGNESYRNNNPKVSLNTYKHFGLTGNKGKNSQILLRDLLSNLSKKQTQKQTPYNPELYENSNPFQLKTKTKVSSQSKKEPTENQIRNFEKSAKRNNTLKLKNVSPIGINPFLGTYSKPSHSIAHSIAHSITHSITHFWYRDWPDHGVPTRDEISVFVDFIDTLYADIKTNAGGTVIHCSAGVGRTGTVFVILKLCLEKEDSLSNLMNSNRVTYDDIKNAVSYVRLRRQNTVQTKDQFVFICNIFDIDLSEHNIQKDYDEFANIKLPSVCASSPQNNLKNNSKNRYADILPYDDTRVKLNNTDDCNTDYINASNLTMALDRSICTNLRLNVELCHSPKHKVFNGNVIAAQGPKANTTDDFLQMLENPDLNIKRIIMVTNFIEKGINKCEDYSRGILSNLGKNINFGNITEFKLQRNSSDKLELKKLNE